MEGGKNVRGEEEVREDKTELALTHRTFIWNGQRASLKPVSCTSLCVVDTPGRSVIPKR